MRFANARGSKRWRYALFCGAGALLGAAAFALYRYDPAAGGLLYPPCPTEALFHFYCPGCGTLRALHALLHGDVAQACSQNVLSVLFLLWLPFLLLFPQKFRHPAVSASVLALVLLFAVLRNFSAFACLAPY